MTRIQQDFIIKGAANPFLGYTLLTSFQTNSPSTTTFDPVITANSGQYAWDLGDGTIIINDKVISHTYADNTTKTVKLYGKGTCAISSFEAYGDSIVGQIDLSNDAFKSLTYVDISWNSLVTSIKLPIVSTGILSAFYANYCNLTGTLDLSSYSAFSTSFAIQINVNTGLEELKFASTITQGKIQNLSAYQTGLKGILNLSMFDFDSTSGAVISLYLCTALENITFKSSISGKLNSLLAYNCKFTGTLDMSMIHNFTTSGDINVSNNTGLTSLLLSNSDITGSIYRIIATGCNLTGMLDMSHIVAFYKPSTYGYPSIIFTGNPNLTGISFPSIVSGPIEYITLDNCNLTGTLNLSAFRQFGDLLCDFNFNNNANLNSITFNSSVTKKLRYFSAQNCGLNTTLDLSMFDFVPSGLTIRLNNNPNLQGINFNSSITTGLTELDVTNTGLSGMLDLSNFPQMFYVQGSAHGVTTKNTAITDLKLPLTGTIYALNSQTGTLNTLNLEGVSINVAYGHYYLNDNAMTSAEVNKILVDMNAIASAGYTGRSINLGGTNAKADSTSGGYDGLAARTALIAKGFSVSVNL